MSIDNTEPLYPANAKAIAEFVEETDAEVLRGALDYPGESSEARTALSSVLMRHNARQGCSA